MPSPERLRLQKGSFVRGVLAMIGLWLLSSAVGCGSNAINLCYANCEYRKKCISTSEASYESCQRSCNDQSGSFSDADKRLARDCQNALEIRNKQKACYARACAEVPLCLLSNNELSLCERN